MAEHAALKGIPPSADGEGVGRAQRVDSASGRGLRVCSMASQRCARRHEPARMPAPCCSHPRVASGFRDPRRCSHAGPANVSSGRSPSPALQERRQWVGRPPASGRPVPGRPIKRPVVRRGTHARRRGRGEPVHCLLHPRRSETRAVGANRTHSSGVERDGASRERSSSRAATQAAGSVPGLARPSRHGHRRPDRSVPSVGRRPLRPSRLPSPLRRHPSLLSLCSADRRGACRRDRTGLSGADGVHQQASAPGSLRSR